MGFITRTCEARPLQPSAPRMDSQPQDPHRFVKALVTRSSYSLPLGFILLHVVTHRRQQADGLAPLWGFPLPWTWWPPISSLHWRISLPALGLNLLVYSAVATCLLEPLRRMDLGTAVAHPLL